MSVSIYSQNKFEGYNLVLDAPKTQQSDACALRYLPATTNVTITDLNPATPMSIKSCDGSGTILTKTGATSMNMKMGTVYKWCFTGEDKLYRINYDGDRYSGKQVYNWIATPDEKNVGFYNVKDFGALGDGKTDDTIAIQSALAYIASRAGGVLTFPEGDYLVGNIPAYKGIFVPSGTTIQGLTSIPTGASVNNQIKKNPSRIRLKGSNRPLFVIGECIEKVVIKDIELYAESNENTSGIEAYGAYLSSQDFYFERVTFNNFNRGIFAYGLQQTNYQWQFDYVKINHCRFMFNRDAGIYADLANSDWKIEGSFFMNPKFQPGQNADSMNLVRFSTAVIQDTFGGGFHQAFGGTFIKTLDGGTLTVIGSETEQMTYTFIMNENKVPGIGNYSYPIVFINCFFGPPIIFNGRRTFVSVGNGYNPKTFQADEQVRVYSTGDRFCYDGHILGCKDGGTERFTTQSLFDKATIISMTGQPAEGKTPGIPTIFGTDVQFNAPIQMPSLRFNQLPKSRQNGSMVYCSDCRRNTTPCQTGGEGAPAMMVSDQWSCL